MKIDNTSQCEGCRFCTIDESNKAIIKVWCELDEKNRYFGQYVECDRKEIINAD